MGDRRFTKHREAGVGGQCFAVDPVRVRRRPRSLRGQGDLAWRVTEPTERSVAAPGRLSATVDAQLSVFIASTIHPL